jgi:hypothetical protein
MQNNIRIPQLTAQSSFAFVIATTGRHNRDTIDLLYRANSPVVDRRDSLFPQSESVIISETIQSIVVSTPVYKFETCADIPSHDARLPTAIHPQMHRNKPIVMLQKKTSYLTQFTTNCIFATNDRNSFYSFGSGVSGASSFVNTTLGCIGAFFGLNLA